MEIRQAHRDVVVPVQKDQRPLPQNNESRVDELEHFGHGEHFGPKPGDALGIGSSANGVDEGVGADGPGRMENV